MIGPMTLITRLGIGFGSETVPDAQEGLIRAAIEAEAFISTFEGAELQDGVDALLAQLRGALKAAGVSLSICSGGLS